VEEGDLRRRRRNRPLKERIIGRFSSDDVINPINPSEILVGAGELDHRGNGARIDELGIERVKVMSPLTSISKGGIDAKSYGINPATNKVAKIGDSVGIIAAQSIGEPGTQLTMRTFHIGGVATGGFKTPEIRVRSSRHREISRSPSSSKPPRAARSCRNKTATIQILDADDKEVEVYNIVSAPSSTLVTARRSTRARSWRNGIPTTFPCSPKRAARSRSRT
jgi:DNA-directed RNA polymerase subunit beta'